MALNRPAMQAVSGAEDTPVSFKVISSSCQLRPGPNLDYFAIGLLRKGAVIRGFPFIISGTAWIKLVEEDATIHVPDPARREDGVWIAQVHPKHGRLVESQEEEVRYGQGPGSCKGEEGTTKIKEGGRGYGKIVEIRISASFEEMLQAEWTISNDKNLDTVVLDVTHNAIEMVIDRASGRPPASGKDELLESSAGKTLRPETGAIVKRVDCATDLQATISNMPDGRYFLISAVVTFDRRYMLRSRWIRAATLNVDGRDRSLGNTDPGGNIRGPCQGKACACQEFVAMGVWSLNSDPTVLCRRCGCANIVHAICGRAFQAGRNTPQPVAEGSFELPPEARDWDERERNLWRWSNGALNPRKDPHAQRKRLAKDIINGKRGKVSVVVPTMEERQVFHEQVWACFSNQTWPDKELIVIETYQSRSSDTFRYIKDVMKDPRLVYLRFRCGQTTELSIGAKRNIAQHIASGDYIANFDDDDLYAPSYLSTMINAMYNLNVDYITLSSWYFFDIVSGRFGFFDAVEWAKVKKMREKDIDGWLWGYGFSYVHKLQPALDRKINYPDQNMEEDILYIRAWKDAFGDACAALFYDSVGIVLHTLHGRNTSNSFALREVPRDEALDTDFADLQQNLEVYLRMFPRNDGPSKFIENEADESSAQRRYRDLRVHWLEGDFEVKCTRGAYAGEVHMLCADFLKIAPEDFCFFRSTPQCGFVWVWEKENSAQQTENAMDMATQRYNEYMPILGTWVYGAKATEYVLSMTGDGRCCQFEGPHSRVGKVSGVLQPVGAWLRAELKSPEGETVGFIRLKYIHAAQKMISNYRSAGREEWGKDILAQRIAFDEPAGADAAAGKTGAAELAALSAVAGEEATAQEAEEPPNLPLQAYDRVGSATQELWLVITHRPNSEHKLSAPATHMASTGNPMPTTERASVENSTPATQRAESTRTASAEDAPPALPPEGVQGETLQLVVHIDQSLNLREKLEVHRGCTVGHVKERLARLDLTGGAKRSDLRLKWEGLDGAELHDDDRVSGAFTELELCALSPR